MSKILIPGDRTTSQPVTAYCQNFECLVDGQRFEFPTEGDVKCPKCGANQAPMIGLLSLIHFMVRDPVGPIQGAAARYHLACAPKRRTLATATNLESASDQLIAVNCPGCLDVANHQRLAAIQGTSITS